MSAALGLILLSAWIEAAGLGLLALIFGGRLPGRAWPERLGLGYIMGLGAACWLAFLWMFAGLRFNWAGVAALTLPIIAGGAWRAWRGSPSSLSELSGLSAPSNSTDQSGQSDSSTPSPPSFLSRAAYWALVAVCAVAVIYQTIYLMHLPLHGFDALQLWGYKTQILIHRGALWTPEDTEAAVTNTPRTYPHFLPVAQMLHARAAAEPLIEGGAWKVFFGLLQAAFIAVFYGFARRRLGPLAAMAFTALAATMPHFVNIEDGGPVSGYADVMLAVYYFLAAGGVWLWLEEGDRRWLVLAALATGLCYFAKREGVFAVVLNGVAVLALSGGWVWRGAVRRKVVPALLFALIVLVIILPEWIYCRAVEASPDYFGVMLSNLSWEWFASRTDRLWYAVEMSARYLFLNPHTWALTWWAAAIVAMLRFRTVARPAMFYLLLATAVLLANFCLVVALIEFDLEAMLLVTFPRMVQITIGPVFLFLAFLLVPWLPPNDKGQMTSDH